MTQDATAVTGTPPVVRFVDEEGRREVVTLLYPLEVDGRIWSEIVVRRTTVAEVRDWTRRVVAAKAAGDDDPNIPLPVFDAPEAVLDALDPDDEDRLEEVARVFLPRRFLAGPKG